MRKEERPENVQSRRYVLTVQLLAFLIILGMSACDGNILQYYVCMCVYVAIHDLPLKVLYK